MEEIHIKQSLSHICQQGAKHAVIFVHQSWVANGPLEVDFGMPEWPHPAYHSLHIKLNRRKTWGDRNGACFLMYLKHLFSEDLPIQKKIGFAGPDYRKTGQKVACYIVSVTCVFPLKFLVHIYEPGQQRQTQGSRNKQCTLISPTIINVISVRSKSTAFFLFRKSLTKGHRYHTKKT